MLKKLRIIITLILLMGQLLPAKVLADKNISSNKINSVSKIVKTKSAISQVTGSNVDKINSSEATKKDSADTNNHLISNSENTYKLSTIGNGIVLGNNGRVVITATKVIKNNIYVVDCKFNPNFSTN